MALIDTISNLIFNVYEAYTVAVFLKEGNTTLKCRSSMTFSTHFNKTQTIQIENTLPGWVVKHNTQLVIPNFDKDESTLGYYTSTEGIKAFMGYPIEDRGVLVVDSKKKWGFTDKEKKMLHLFISMILEELDRESVFFKENEGLAEIYNERRVFHLFGELWRGNISVKDVLLEGLGFCGGDGAFIGVEEDGLVSVVHVVGVDPTLYEKKRCSRNESIAAMVVNGGRELLLPFNSGLLRERPLFFTGEGLRPRQLFGFPLTAEDTPYGVVGFISLTEKRLKEESIPTLRMVANLLSLYFSFILMKEYVKKAQSFETVTDSTQFPIFVEKVTDFIKKGERFSLLSVKIKGVRRFNELLGFEFTNNLLKRVSEIIKFCVDGYSMISRRGGGHFYVVSKNRDRNKMQNILKIIGYTIKKYMAEQKIEDCYRGVEAWVRILPDDGFCDLWEFIDKKNGKSLSTGE
ncbi:MAG: diguanylate cyclase [Syntrophorhabdaceae bacterium]|nr:diguanylate cyclase [Syntrophorhabdaceae bacterium]